MYQRKRERALFVSSNVYTNSVPQNVHLTIGTLMLVSYTPSNRALADAFGMLKCYKTI